MNFNPLQYPICFETPRRLKLPNWQPHIPFALFLVAAHRPGVLVELGTHYGDSYCAFCQGVKSLGLSTRCYAVDTWRGDPHSGQYGPEVLADLRDHHDPLYAEFSTLVQQKFDEAVSLFDEGSIDLLHIDGCHSYKAVKHDFETWLPKMSTRGLLLLHDTAVYGGDFGVWKLWGELTTRYPHFAFNHASGLGLLGIGKEFPEAIDSLFRADPAEAGAVHQYFRTLGAQIRSASSDGLSSLDEWSNVAKGQIHAIHEHERRLDERVAELSASLEGAILRGTQEDEGLRSAVTQMIGRLDALEGWSATAKAQIHSSYLYHDISERRITEVSTEVDGIASRLGDRMSSVEEKLAQVTAEAADVHREMIAVSGQVIAFDRRLAHGQTVDASRRQRIEHLDGRVADLAARLERQSKETSERFARDAERIDELEATRAELAGPLEFLRLLIDLQHRIGVPFTISGISRKIRRVDQWLKRRGIGPSPSRAMEMGPVQSLHSDGAVALLPDEGLDPPMSDNQILGNCEQPPLDVVARVGSTIRVEGWATAPSGVRQVLAFVDDQELGEIDYGQSRPDVARAFPQLADAEYSGFRGYLDLRSLPAGRHRLRVRIDAAGGNSREFAGVIDFDPACPGMLVPVPDFHAQYQVWLQHHRPTENWLRALAGAAERLEYRPVFSILVPVFNPAPRFLRLAIESVLAQVYPGWELCVVDDRSTDPQVRHVLEEFARLDSRIQVVFSERNLGIAEATNAAFDLARGEFVGFLDHDDELWPQALYECAKLLNRQPDVDLIYSDEDKIAPDGHHYDAFFKPDWSPDLLMSTMYVGHLSVYRRALIVELGKMRAEYSGSQDYDLALRVTEKSNRIRHIPTVLYSWRAVPGSAASDDEAKPAALAAARRALEDALVRRGLDGVVEPSFAYHRWDVHYRISGTPSVCIIVPSGGNAKRLAAEIPSFLGSTSYPALEFLVVDNSSSDEIHRLVSSLQQEYPSLRHLEFRHRPFNYSAIINYAVRQVTADYVVIMNDDLTVCESGWLEAMLEHAQRPEVGIVGAKLLYPEGTIQHAGVVLGIGGVAGHVYKRYPASHPGPLAILEVVRNVSAVTFACVMLRRSVFEELGGLDEVNFPVSFNDVDFCLRAGQRGYRVVFTPRAVLYHHESATRSKLPSSAPGEVEFMQEAWADIIRSDPFYNPNLTLTREDGSIAVVNS